MVHIILYIIYRIINKIINNIYLVFILYLRDSEEGFDFFKSFCPLFLFLLKYLSKVVCNPELSSIISSL